MADYSVFFDRMRICQESIDKCKSLIDKSSSNLSDINNRLPATVMNSLNIRVRLSSSIGKVNTIGNGLASLSKGIGEATLKYLLTEAGIVGEKPVSEESLIDRLLEYNQDGKSEGSYLTGINWTSEDGKTKYHIFGEEGSYSLGALAGTASITDFLFRFENDDYKGYVGKVTEKGEYSLKSKDKMKGRNDAIKDSLIKNGLRDEYNMKSRYFDSDGNEILEKDAPEYYKKKATVFEEKAEASVSASVYEGKDDFGWMDVKTTVGNAEAHASIAGGMYVVGPKGENIFSPGVNAEIGASATAFKIGAETETLGNDMLGVDGSLSVTVGKAEAKAEVGLQTRGKDGSFDPQFNAGVNLEGTLAEVKGDVTGHILGTDVKVGGKAGFGLGGHMDVGYKDGIFKFDAGLYTGVGASLNFEVDVGDTVDTIVGLGKAAIDGLADGLGTLGRIAGDIGEGIVSVASDIGEGIVNVASGIGEGIVNVATGIGEGLGNTIGFIGESVSSFFSGWF